jgi:hypothetical protein
MRYALILTLFLLTACAGAHSNQVYSQLNNAGQREGDAWQIAWKLGNEECPHGTEDKPLPRSQAVKRQDCYDRLINTHVMPVAFAPTLLMDYMTEERKISIAYKKGKLDRDTANLKSQENWNSYFKAITDKADQIYATAHKQDQQLAKEQQQYFQNLSKELREAETKRHKENMEALKHNKIKTTNCYGSGNHISCTTL